MTGDAMDDELSLRYLIGKRLLLQRGFAAEIDWQDEADPYAAADADVVREGAWAIVACGLSDHVVRGIFPSLSNVFELWERPSDIAIPRPDQVAGALQVLNHPRKIQGIATLAYLVSCLGARRCVWLLEHEPQILTEPVPFLGPVSTVHLKKNLGFPVAKPDRHLRRLADLYSTNASELCLCISARVGDKPSVVDIVLWRLAEQRLIWDVFDRNRPSSKSTAPELVGQGAL